MSCKQLPCFNIFCPRDGMFCILTHVWITLKKLTTTERKLYLLLRQDFCLAGIGLSIHSILNYFLCGKWSKTLTIKRWTKFLSDCKLICRVYPAHISQPLAFFPYPIRLSKHLCSWNGTIKSDQQRRVMSRAHDGTPCLFFLWWAIFPLIFSKYGTLFNSIQFLIRSQCWPY